MWNRYVDQAPAQYLAARPEGEVAAGAEWLACSYTNRNWERLSAQGLGVAGIVALRYALAEVLEAEMARGKER